MDRLRRDRVPLEVCPTSNICLGLAPDVAHHPFDELRRAGLEVSINTDDPALFDTTLSEEFRRVGEAFSYTPEVLAKLALAAAEHSFLPEAEKRAHLAAMREEILAAASRHLGRELEI